MGLVALIAVVLAFMVYNNLIRLRNNVTRAWSNVDVLLQKRHDLIPNLINVVKGYKQYEQTLLVKLTQMRSLSTQIQNSDNVQNKAAASDQISSTFKTLFANVEKYPQLKSDNLFMQLQGQLVEIENEIADSRQFYNDSVKVYNTSISVVPNSLFASILKYTAMQYFQASDSEMQNVNVST